MSSSAHLSAEDILSAEPFPLELDPGVQLAGIVVDLEGAPIEGAKVSPFSEGRTGPDGRFEVWVRSEDRGLFVHAPDFRSELVELDAAEDLQHLRVELSPERQIRVTCTGGETGACLDVNGLTCVGEDDTRAPPHVLHGVRRPLDDALPVSRGGWPHRGRGPAGRVRRRHHRSHPGARRRGTRPGPAAGRWCAPSHVASRCPRPPDTDLSVDQLFSSVRIDVDEGGHFDTTKLAPGQWTLSVYGKAPFRDVDVPEQGVVDLGDIELGGSGSVEGTMQGSRLVRSLHGLVRLEPAEGPATLGVLGHVDDDGSFRFSGIPAGDYRLHVPTAPTASTTVTVEDGVITDGIVLAPPERFYLERFGLWVDLEGDTDMPLGQLDPNGIELVVGEVEPGSLADEAGLGAGDLITAAATPRTPTVTSHEQAPPPMVTVHYAIHLRASALDLTVGKDGTDVVVHLE